MAARCALSKALSQNGPRRPDRRVASPLLVITGEEDTGSTPAMARRMVADYPDARCVILPGLRHLALVEAPDAVTEPLMWFLSRGTAAPETEERKA